MKSKAETYPWQKALVFVVIGLVFMAVSLFSVRANAQCDDVPKVDWWGNVTHEKMITYVQRRHQGDWDQYLTKWENYLSKMQLGLAEGKTAHVKKKGVSLEGRALADYVVKIEKRVNVIRCLMDEQTGSHTQNVRQEAATGNGAGHDLFDEQPAAQPAVPSPSQPVQRQPKVYFKKIQSHPGLAG